MSRGIAAVVDPYTSGSYLAAHLRRIGYDCLGVQSQSAIPGVFRSSVPSGEFERVVQHQGDLAQTSARLAAEGVAFVIAGCELGVELADQLSGALGLPSNGADARKARRDKGLMAEAFRNAGLRVPRQFCSDKLDAVLRWVRNETNGPLVVKPCKSSCSDGVQLCANEADVERAFHAIIGRENILGLINRQVVVQEYLSGPEYVVDTVSCEGRHQLVAFWRYRKPAPTASFMGYEAMELLPGSGEIQERLGAEACGGLDALQIRFGPGHSELVWTDSGPMLLEIGARMHGGDNPLLAARCGARSHIDETIRACAEPTRFATAREPGYQLTHHCTLAFLMPPTRGRLRAMPRMPELEALESLHKLVVPDCVGKPVPQVIGWLALIHRDKQVVDRNLEDLRKLEADGLYDIEP